MSDLISRSDAMMKARPEYLNPNQKGHEEYNKAWNDGVKAYWNGLKELPSELEWIPCSERLPSEEDCPMDCMVTRRGKFMGNYVDMAVAESNGTWTHEDWKAIVLGDAESGRKTGLISTRDDEIIAWMPLPEPYKEQTERSE